MKKNPFGYEHEVFGVPTSAGDASICSCGLPRYIPLLEHQEGCSIYGSLLQSTRSPAERAAEGTISVSNYNTAVEKLRDAMASAESLQRFLMAAAPEQAKLRRMPFGLVNEKQRQYGSGVEYTDINPGEQGIIKFSPDVTMKPRFMVLSEETAEAFNIIQFLIANVNHVPSPLPLPLETFSVKYYAACVREDGVLQRLIDTQTWGAFTCTPANRIQIYVQNVGKVARQFRGILWADIVDIF